MYNELVSKYQYNISGVVVELTAPTMRYVEIATGYRRDKTTGLFAADVSDGNADHELDDTPLATTGCYGWTFAAVGGRSCVVQLYDAGEFVHYGYLYAGQRFCNSRQAPLSDAGAIRTNPAG